MSLISLLLNMNELENSVKLGEICVTYCHETTNCHKNRDIDLCFPVDRLQENSWSANCTGQQKSTIVVRNMDFFKFQE